MTIRSFSVAFAFERRLFKIDRWRVPLAYGLPLRSLAYAVAVLVAILVAGRLPLAGALVGALPAPLRYLILPGAAASALTQVNLDGRTAHVAALALLRAHFAPARVVAFRRAPERGSALLGQVTCIPDEGASGYRRACVRGPATLHLRYPARAAAHGSTLRLHARAGGPLARSTHIVLRRGQRVVFR